MAGHFHFSPSGYYGRGSKDAIEGQTEVVLPSWSLEPDGTTDTKQVNSQVKVRCTLRKCYEGIKEM